VEIENKWGLRGPGVTGRAEHDAALTRTSVYVKIQYVMHLAQSTPLAVRILLHRQERLGGKCNPLGRRERTGQDLGPIRHSWPNWMGKC